MYNHREREVGIERERERERVFRYVAIADSDTTTVSIARTNYLHNDAIRNRMVLNFLKFDLFKVELN